jgi:hypothetical protein
MSEGVGDGLGVRGGVVAAGFAEAEGMKAAVYWREFAFSRRGVRVRRIGRRGP